jgi:hypothetical protein
VPSLRWPFWAHADETLQNIVRSNKISLAESEEYCRQHRSNSVFTEDMTDGASTPPSSLATEPGPSTQIIQPVGKHREEREDIRERQAGPELKSSESYHRAEQRLPRRPTRKPRVSKLALALKKHLMPVSSKHVSNVTRVQKRAPLPSRQTRSRNRTNFYELDLNGVAMKCRIC